MCVSCESKEGGSDLRGHSCPKAENILDQPLTSEVRGNPESGPGRGQRASHPAPASILLVVLIPRGPSPCTWLGGER
jgi:hypothetical protein